MKFKYITVREPTGTLLVREPTGGSASEGVNRGTAYNEVVDFRAGYSVIPNH